MLQGILWVTGLIRNRVFRRPLAGRHRDALCALELRRPGKDCWAVILPDLSSQRRAFKVQHLDRTGLGSHVGGYPTPEAALRAAVAAGYTEQAPGIVEELALSTRWQALYRTDFTPQQTTLDTGDSFAIPKSPNSPWFFTPEKQHRMIAEAAYFRAERRGFQGGSPIEDWLAAEREIKLRDLHCAQPLREDLEYLSPQPQSC